MKVGQFLFDQAQPARMRKTALHLALLALAVVHWQLRVQVQFMFPK